MPSGPPCEVGINISILQVEKNKPPFFMARTSHPLAAPRPPKMFLEQEQKENNRLLSLHYMPAPFPLTIALNMPQGP